MRRGRAFSACDLSVDSEEKECASGRRAAWILDVLMRVVKRSKRVLVCSDPVSEVCHVRRAHVPPPQRALINVVHRLQEEGRS